MYKWYNTIPLTIFFLTVAVFFSPFLLFGRIPIPADTIVGMYHPWRDILWYGFVSGVPYKNPLITDPVRQQYVWRQLAIEQIKQGQLPLWNPYSFSGTPLLANFQSAPFYPLNVLFFILPFPIAWGIGVMLQPFLAGIFLYVYLRYFVVNRYAAVMGAIIFAFSGFSIAWMEWNTVIHTILWLPLILLAKEHLIRRFRWSWAAVLILAESSAIFAGHLQVVFYTVIFSTVYLFARIIQLSMKEKTLNTTINNTLRRLLPFIYTGLIVASITAIQWIPTFQFIQHSARDVDGGSWEKAGWFIPWQHLMQFIAPDFFGNPTTNNYWGQWNYGEFIGYIGILPLLLVLYALFFRKDKKTYAFGAVFIGCLLLALPTPIAKLPYQWNIPFLATSQPTRLLSLICFCLSILAALGLDDWIRRGTAKKILISSLILLGGLTVGWLFAILPQAFSLQVSPANLLVMKKNLILPTILTGFSFFILTLQLPRRRKGTAGFFSKELFVAVVLLIAAADLLRFGWKFTPFSPSEWIYPKTKIVQYIKDNQGYQRTMTTDRRILPPNMSAAYGIYDIAGYDPLYLLSYNQLVGAWTRNAPNIAPSAFNRILTPDNPESFFADLLGVKYVVSFGEHPSKKLKFIMNEGQTYLYENPDALPRAFFVLTTEKMDTMDDEMGLLFHNSHALRYIAVSTEVIPKGASNLSADDMVTIVSNNSNRMIIETISEADHLLVVTDPYYPTWKASIDGKRVPLYEVDFMFRGVMVPQGEHTVEFKNYLL